MVTGFPTGWQGSELDGKVAKMLPIPNVAILLKLFIH